MRFVPLLAAWLLTGLYSFSHAKVELIDEGRTFLLRNAGVSARIDKTKGTLVSLQRGKTELLSGGSGYWSFTGHSDLGRAQGFPELTGAKILTDPSSTQGKLGEIALEGRYREGTSALPVHVSFRYALTDRSTGLYLYACFDHPAGLPGFGLAEARYVIKPDPRVFDTLTVDPDRSRRMPAGKDWDQGTQLNLKEVRRLNSGIHQGEVEHKYAYSALLSESPAYGWSSSTRRLGLWMVHPSLEFVAGGPTKVELTGHLDVNPGGRPVLLSMWQGSHYGGGSLHVRRDESWKKWIGPILLHTNEGGNALELWRDAMNQVGREARQWPYAWITDPAYQARERVAVTGSIQFYDPFDTSARPGRMWVGLTAPDYRTGSGRRSETVTWERDGKSYQYWTRAGRDGSFRLPSVRPGTYVLRAFADGILGEFSQASVTVAPGKPLDLGKIRWIPLRSGPQVWQIGIPDRSAREFRHGDEYWKWGHHLAYQREFPEGVDFTIGRSDPKTDWNIYQPLRFDPETYRILGPSTWKVRFQLKETDDHRLTLALCGHRSGDRLDLRLNGSPFASAGPLPENGVMHRDGYRGNLTTLSFTIPGRLTQKGANVLELELHGRVWHQAVLYDCLRLERIDPSLTRSEP